MKQFRISHLLLLIIICGLCLGLVIQTRRSWQIEAAMRKELEMERQRGEIREAMARQREAILAKKFETLESIRRDYRAKVEGMTN